MRINSVSAVVTRLSWTATAQRGFILMDRATVVQRFGRPTSIGESRNGASEQWNYRVEDVSVTLTIRGDYVIRIS